MFCLIGVVYIMQRNRPADVLKPKVYELDGDGNEDVFLPNLEPQYTQPPSRVPAFIPPPTYVTSTIVNRLAKLPAFTWKPLTAPAYRPPPPYPGRKISEAPLCTTTTGVALPIYKPPPTFTRAMTKIRTGQLNSAPAYMPPPEHF